MRVDSEERMYRVLNVEEKPGIYLHSGNLIRPSVDIYFWLEEVTDKVPSKRRVIGTYTHYRGRSINLDRLKDPNRIRRARRMATANLLCIIDNINQSLISMCRKHVRTLATTLTGRKD